MINIKRSESPRQGFKYSDTDIQDQIKKDFLGKCYLCEESTRHTEVDHFHPQKYFPDGVDNWDNLFLCCQKCNKIKPKDTNSTKDKEILNNCKDDVESLIKLKMNSKENKVEITGLQEDSSTKLKLENTIKLLERIYNGKDAPLRGKIASDSLRKAVSSELARFNSDLNLSEEALINHLQKRSSFFSMKKWIVIEDQELKERFGNLI